MPDKWDQYAQPAQQGDKWEQYAQPPTQPPPATPAQPSLVQKALTGVGNFGKGIAKGAVGTMANTDDLVRKIPGIGEFLTTPITGTPADQAIAHAHQLAEPHTLGQTLGKGTEQAAEFLIPGAGEERGAAALASLAPKLGKAAMPIAKVLTAGAGSGLVNKAQGGDFSTGAAFGAGGQVVGQGLKAVAPVVAETALGIPKAARAFGRTPGAAILNETRGIRPETIAESASQKLGQLNPELNQAVAKSQTPASLLPARGIATAEMGKAQAQNAPRLFNQIQAMDSHLSNRFDTGVPIQSSVTPSELLDLKRGFGAEHVHNWNPEISDRAKGVGRQMYHALDSELDRAVPESRDLNQRISSLIPVERRAESVSRNAPVVQKALGRFGAHTGALTLGAAGAYEGRREGGLPGAIVGGLTGVLAPELIASPEAQMIAARSLNNAGGLRPLVGSALQLDRKKAK